MAEPFPYDRVMKDIFFHDRPRFLQRLTGGKPIREIVNSDLPKTLERRADMVLLVDPAELHHVEFQSHNFAGLPYRQGVDCFLLAERYKKRRIVQSVIYFGDAPMRMPGELDTGAGLVRYRLIDIREYDSVEIAEGGGAADLVLAVLARGGMANLKGLLERICRLPAAARNRALAQIALLAGLRRMSETFKMEMNRMGWATEIAKNEFLRDYFEQAEARGVEKGIEQGIEQGIEKGIEKGIEQGITAGKRSGLRAVLEAKFGRLPHWAVSKIEQAKPSDLERWLRKSVSARSLETLLGRK